MNSTRVMQELDELGDRLIGKGALYDSSVVWPKVHELEDFLLRNGCSKHTTRTHEYLNIVWLKGAHHLSTAHLPLGCGIYSMTVEKDAILSAGNAFLEVEEN